jgi:3-deoxy-D-manno-octulosonic-acid transferase
MDAIEKILFDHDYLSSFDKITVQTEAVKDSLVAKGIDPVRVSVTGNMKFDSILNERPPLVDPVSTAIVDSLLNSGRPVLVAGCITDIAEFSELFQVLIDLKSKYSGLIAVFAPRHPENQELMSDIRNMLDDSGLAFRYKSGMDNADIDNIDLIVLDTIGELKAFFYCGDLCYMGKNHNILEPLSFGKPVFTINGWESTYPSYPVYRIAAENGIIRCSEGCDKP